MNNPDERPEKDDATETLPDVVRQMPLEVPVAEFEGEYIRTMIGKLPAISMEMPVGYRRNTHLKMEIEVRIKEVNAREVGRERDLVREHVFALEEIKLLGAYTSDELDPGVGGSAAVGAPGDEDEDEDPAQTEETDERPEGGG